MGRGALEFLEKGETMNGACYRRILDDKLEFFMYQHVTSHLVQNCAPCHKSKIVTQWFNEQPNIILIKWPGNSPDLNPIENVWSWMKAKLRDSSAKNMEEWRREITELWTLRMSDSDYLRKLVASMPKRMLRSLRRMGGLLTTSLWTYMTNKLLILQKIVFIFYFFGPRSHFLRR
jgi:hypothetical protein